MKTKRMDEGTISINCNLGKFFTCGLNNSFYDNFSFAAHFRVLFQIYSILEISN